jgi:hypothetical protein
MRRQTINMTLTHTEIHHDSSILLRRESKDFHVSIATSLRANSLIERRWSRRRSSILQADDRSTSNAAAAAATATATCVTPTDFEMLCVIGQGAFGKVRMQEKMPCIFTRSRMVR